MTSNTFGATVPKFFAHAGFTRIRTGSKSGSGIEASEHVAGLFGTLRVAENVVASGDELHRRREVTLAASRRVRDRRRDDAEDDAADETEQDGHQRVAADDE